MNDLYIGDTYVIKKKANYKERLTCCLLSTDNVFKIYDWDELTVTKGRRLIRLEQFSPLTMRTLCCSQQRAYRTIGDASNRSRILTKSIRSFRWMCPCNNRKPITAVFDS